MLESKIEKAVCDYAKKTYNFKPYKFTSPARRSVPDRLFCGPGNIHFFIEFKATGKDATDAQQREITKLLERDHIVYVIDDIIIGKQLVDCLVQAPYLAPAPSATRLSNFSYQAPVSA